MTTESETPDGVGGMKTFRSKKELVALVAASLIFGFVIWKMYLSGDDRAGGVPEPDHVVDTVPAEPTAEPSPAPPASPASEPAAPAGATFTPQQVIEMVQADEAAETRAESPAKLARDPFAMSEKMRDEVMETKPTTPPPTVDPAEVVTLTPENAARTLAGIPGGERAAQAGLRLQGCMVSGSIRAAVINGRTVLQGRKMLGFTLESVGPEDAILRLGRRRVRLVIPRIAVPGGDR
jgi:hypothetical protein